MSADLDKAIDRAVREMLDVEPPADLRAAVIARIDERPASSFQLPAFSFQRFAVLVGTAAAVVLVLVLARYSAVPTAPPPLVARGGDRPMVVPPALPQSPIDIPTTPEGMAAAARNTVPHRPGGVVYAASIDTAPDGPAIDPLNTIAPIEVAPIAHRSITPEPIGVRPLDRITEMQIAPLSPPDGRD
jgi:hypothetical protein